MNFATGLLSLVLPADKVSEFAERSNLSISLRLVNSGVLAKRLDGAQQLEAFLGAVRRAGQPAPAAAPAAAAPSAHEAGMIGPVMSPCKHLSTSPFSYIYDFGC
jgi:hypothetical protein